MRVKEALGRKERKMARNYSTAEAVKILHDGIDMEAVSDLHRRFPVFTYNAMKALANGGGDMVKFMSGTPEYVTARKFERAIIAAADGEEVADDDEETEEAPFDEDEEKAEPKKAAPKKRAAKKEEPKDEEPEAEPDDDGKYSGMNAMELFKECKKRGIKAAPKKPAKFYIELLEKDDAKADDSDDSDEDDDWDI